MHTYDNIPDQITPYTGSFNFDIESKSEILACFPSDIDDIDALRRKLQHLVAITWMLYNDTHPDPPTVL